ncbi:MAG: flagellar biosynthetic protein FliQ [Deltaproteobacteria bacterium]|nr:flagellar biosynthetic protein FliQ [Deltaproteobacteria bacterium]
MDAAFLVELFEEALFLLLLLCAPVLTAALLTSVLVGWLSHYTKLSEPAIGSMARILAVLAGLLVFAPWIAQRVLGFTEKTWQLLQAVVQ